MGLRQTLLRDVGLQVMAIDRHMHSVGERDLLMQQMTVQKPDLLWLKLQLDGALAQDTEWSDDEQST